MTDYELSPKTKKLLKKVQNTEGTSYAILASETEEARSLVERNYCFYSMDYDHLIAYGH